MIVDLHGFVTFSFITERDRTRSRALAVSFVDESLQIRLNISATMRSQRTCSADLLINPLIMIRCIFTTTFFNLILCLCPRPPPLMDGSWEANVPQVHGGPFQVGRKITFSCLSGFVLEGNQMIECLTNSTWSGSVPVCESNELKWRYRIGVACVAVGSSLLGASILLVMYKVFGKGKGK